MEESGVNYIKRGEPFPCSNKKVAAVPGANNETIEYIEKK